VNLIYFKSDIGNFGDDLNPWLWNKIFGDFENYNSDVDFVGIGSILDNRIFENRENKKVIFGSGVRDFDFRINEYENVDIRFVRGPISSRLTNSDFITDAAYALRQVETENVLKKYKISYIPYFRNYYNFNWRLFEKILGIHVINPCEDIEKVIGEIKSSETILTTAMHGAILADLFRIPWMRVKFTKNGNETNLTSELKWNDWLMSVGLKNINTHYLDFDLNYIVGKKKLAYNLLQFYRKFKYNDFILSKDDKIAEIDERICKEISEVKDIYLNK